jgi:hypothetical protein
VERRCRFGRRRRGPRGHRRADRLLQRARG